jgi:hypothetical protein
MQWLGVGALVVGTVLTLWVVPGTAWTDSRPETRALYGYLVTLVVLAACRVSPRGSRIEHIGLAVFLVAMPLVYIEAAWRAGLPLGVELVGLVVYGALAAVGTGRPWVLVAGIALHGLGWDLWHRHGAVVADWYAVGCAVIDVSLAAYAATRVREWSSTTG